MNIANLLDASARRLPDAGAVAQGARTVLTYRELALRVARLSAGLRFRLGLKAGDRVALYLQNCVEYFEVLFAIWHAGLVAVPVNAKLHPRELQWILGNSGARACFASGNVEGVETIGVRSAEFDALQLEAQAPDAEVRPDDPAWLFYTSGTTGTPKGAMLTHRNLLFATQAYFSDIDRLFPGDAILHPAPLSHGSGLYALPHFAAGALNVIPESGGFDAEEVFSLVDFHPNSSFFAAPTMIVRLLGSPAARAVPNLKTITYGGAPMYVADAVRAIDLFGPRLYQLFGQGESPMTITGLPQSWHADKTHPRFLERLASCGFARTGVEVRVVGDDDRDLPPGEVGEIVTRSDCVMAGYWGNPEATAKTLRGGWLHTGDLGSLDEEGFLTIRDRSKDMIISGGSNIYPREIEEVLLTHPDVAECSVVGRPHPEWGEEVVAFVVARPGTGLTARTLDELCLANIARFKRPKHYRFVAALPKNNYGKVLKTELRKLGSESTFPPES
ncbi:MAG: long-chain fatty acid--CoA ligase [Proteobacteria bacterium]|nr:long-chain fatty acid--CoA ligase [Pseudomonadota bacterium]